MAKSRALAIGRPNVIVVRGGGGGGRFRRAGRRVVQVVRRGGRAGLRALPTTSIILGGVGVGWADGKGYLDQLPTLGGSKMTTIGVAGWFATRMRQPWLRAAGFAALGAASFDFGRKVAGGVSGWEGNGNENGW